MLTGERSLCGHCSPSSAEQQSIVALVDEVKANHAEAASAFQEQVDHLRAEVDRHAQDAEAARQLAR